MCSKLVSVHNEKASYIIPSLESRLLFFGALSLFGLFYHALKCVPWFWKHLLYVYITHYCKKPILYINTLFKNYLLTLRLLYDFNNRHLKNATLSNSPEVTYIISRLYMFQISLTTIYSMKCERRSLHYEIHS